MTPATESIKSQSGPGPATGDTPPAGRVKSSRWLIVTVAGLLLFAAVVGFAVYQWRKPDASSASPAGAVATGIPVGRATAPVTVDVYEDLRCAACRAFTFQTASPLDNLINSGTVEVVYHPVTFLDAGSGSGYSSRAARAAACAAQSGVFRRYVGLLFANMPATDGPGLTDDQLIQLGREAGANGGFASCVSDGTYAGWVRTVSDVATQAGVSTLPTVLVNGRRIEPTRAALLRAVEAAR